MFAHVMVSKQNFCSRYAFNFCSLLLITDVIKGFRPPNCSTYTFKVAHFILTVTLEAKIAMLEENLGITSQRLENMDVRLGKLKVR